MSFNIPNPGVGHFGPRYGVLIQSMPNPNLIRQTIVVPDSNYEPIVFNRTVPTKRIEGERYRWQSGQPEASLEAIYGQPMVAEFTAIDQSTFAETGKISSFGQKLERKAGQPMPSDRTNVRLSDFLQKLLAVWTTDSGSFKAWYEAQVFGSAAEPIHISEAVAEAISKIEEASEVQSEVKASAKTEYALGLRIPTIEDPQVASYVNRQNVGGSGVSDLNYALHALDERKNLAINGEAGTGKTSFAKWLAHYLQVPFVNINCTPQLDLGVVEGGFVPQGETHEWIDSEFAQALQVESVILLNESSRMKANQNGYFFTALEERFLTLSQHKGEVIRRHDKCLIITDYNTGYNGTVAHDQAFLDRFGVKMTFDYDIELERNFIKSESLLELASSIRAQRGEVFVETPFSTRLLKNFQSNALDSRIGVQGAAYVLLQSFIDPIERSALKTILDSHLFNIQEEYGVAR